MECFFTCSNLGSSGLDVIPSSNHFSTLYSIKARIEMQASSFKDVHGVLAAGTNRGQGNVKTPGSQTYNLWVSFNSPWEGVKSIQTCLSLRFHWQISYSISGLVAIGSLVAVKRSNCRLRVLLHQCASPLVSICLCLYFLASLSFIYSPVVF